MTRLIRFAAVAAIGMAMLLAGCTSTDEPSGLDAPATSPSAPLATEGFGDAALGDGRHPVYLKTVDLAKREVTFDLIEFYTGADAEQMWKQDNPTMAEVPALNGYYIRNKNTKLRSLPIADGVKAKVLDQSGDPEPVQIDLAELTGSYVGRPFWLDVFEGKITAIEEQFIP